MTFYKKILLILCLCAVCCVALSPSAYATNIAADYDIEQEILTIQEQYQNNFLILAFNEYVKSKSSSGSSAWNTQLKPLFDEILENDYHFYILPGSINYSSPNANTFYVLRLFNYRTASNSTTMNYTSKLNGNTYTINALTYDTTNYSIGYNVSTGVWTLTPGSSSTFAVPSVLVDYKSSFYNEFINLVYNNGGNIDYSTVLYAISSYLATIDGDTGSISSNVFTAANTLSNIYSLLGSISSAVSTIVTNTTTDYTSSISNIYNSVNNIYNYTYDISGNVESIEDYVSDFSTDMSAIRDYLEDDTIDSNSFVNSLPTNSFIPSTQADNIVSSFFDNMRNAFTTENAEDININLPMFGTLTISPTLTERLFPEYFIYLVRAIYWFCFIRAVILYIISLVESIRNFDFVDVHSDGTPKSELL